MLVATELHRWPIPSHEAPREVHLRIRVREDSKGNNRLQMHMMLVAAANVGTVLPQKDDQTLNTSGCLCPAKEGRLRYQLQLG